MDAAAFVSENFAVHGDQPEAVFSRLPEGIALVADAKDLPGMSHLVCHVSGEHLGRWDEGLELLSRLERLPVFDAAAPTGKAVRRQMAVLHRCAGRLAESERIFEQSLAGGNLPVASDRIRLLALASTAYQHQGRLDECIRDFEECLRLASYGPGKDDPAARALAVTSHNIAGEYRERPTLTDRERVLMLRAAETSVTYWKIAGTWVEEDRAEYYLALSHLKAGDGRTALRHAQRCLAIVEGNKGDEYETFFAHECVTRSHHAAGDAASARKSRDAMAALLPKIADDGSRTYAAETLTKVDALLSR
jgi:tetratricopeptide (TPR) repeat protein